MSTSNDVLNFIADFIIKNRYSPTYEEICDGTNITSKSHAKYWVDKLAELGAIERKTHTTRGITKVIRPDGEKVETVIVSTASPSIARRRQRRRQINDKECIYCGATNCAIEDDHFYPRALGGIDSNNIVPSCQRCNLNKSASDPVGWVLDNFDAATLSRVICFLLSSKEIEQM